MDIGTRIKMRRMALGLRQKELARCAEMNAAQLCQIENGRVSPSFGIVERIVAALDTDIPGLYAGISADEPMNPVAEVVDSDYMPIRSHEPDAAVAIEALGGSVVVPVCTFSLNVVPKSFQGGGVVLAEELRASLGLGTAPVGDLVSTLRFRGVRIVETMFAKSVGSVALWDKVHGSPVVLLNSAVTKERQLYRLVYELGSLALFVSFGFRLDETPEQHRFLTDFTGAFLMPAASVRTCVLSVGVAPGDWTHNEVLPIKEYFGVSAESFILRLDELGLIAPALRLKMRDRLREYYKEHPEAMEPHVGEINTCAMRGIKTFF